MYCTNCGKEIADNAVICIHCGCATQNMLKTQKSMLCTVLLWFLLGAIGAHRFYLGHTASAVCMLLCTIFCWLIIPAIILAIWWLIDIILIISGSLKSIDGSELV